MTFIYGGTPDGADGIDGAIGSATVTFRNNVIDLGRNNDTLPHSFIANGPGPNAVVMRDTLLVGGAGADRFEFHADRAGHDRIDDFAADDTIRLAGFGPGLDSLADVLNVTSDTSAGALIQSSANSSILLAGLSKASLQMGDVLF